MLLATPADAGFIVEMARHACVIEDRPLPSPDADDVRELLPAVGETPIVAVDARGRRLGAVWIFHHDPPLLVDDGGASVPELCIGVAPGHRGGGIGGALLDALFIAKTTAFDTLCANVHLRNPARRLYQRKGFHVVGSGRGRLGLLMTKDLAGPRDPG